MDQRQPPESARGQADPSPAPSLRNVVRKSALLNLVVVVTSFPVLAFAAGPIAIIPILKLEAGITAVIWAATFALFSLATLARLFAPPAKRSKRPDPLRQPSDAGVADRWLDGPS